MLVKRCFTCKKEKPISDFRKTKPREQYFYNVKGSCKVCMRIKDKLYRQKPNSKKLIKINQHNNWIKRCENKPWYNTLRKIKYRCNNPKNQKWHRYGGRGIKCLITEEELKELWFRDRAYLMERPSIDRKDNDGHYEFNNCRYIEFNINSMKHNKDKTKCHNLLYKHK